MKTSTKFRLAGGAIIIFDLWLIGQYNITGIPALLLTVGVAAVFEGFLVRPASRIERNPAISPTTAAPPPNPRPSPIVVVGGGILFAVMVAGVLIAADRENKPSGGGEEQFVPYFGPKKLWFFDQWRFDSCMTDAAKNPTTHGVNMASQVCRRRFEQ